MIIKNYTEYYTDEKLDKETSHEYIKLKLYTHEIILHTVMFMLYFGLIHKVLIGYKYNFAKKSFIQKEETINE
jgi:hypothetical protein